MKTIVLPSREALLRLGFLLWLSLGLALAAVAHADPGTAPTDDARALYKKGEDAFTFARYAEAADLFQQAYRLSKRTQLLWNVASSHRRWFDLDKDVAHLRKARAIYENYAALIGNAHEEDEARRAIRAIDVQLTNLPTGAAAIGVMSAANDSDVPEKHAASAHPAPLVDARSTRPTPPPPPAESISPAAIAPGDPAIPLSTPPSGATPVYKKWWLWTLVGVVVAGAGVGLGIALSPPHDATAPTDINAGNYHPTWP